MPAPLAKGVIIVAAIVAAGAIAVYENREQIQEFIEMSRRKLAEGIHWLGDEIAPRQRDQRRPMSHSYSDSDRVSMRSMHQSTTSAREGGNINRTNSFNRELRKHEEAEGMHNPDVGTLRHRQAHHSSSPTASHAVLFDAERAHTRSMTPSTLNHEDPPPVPPKPAELARTASQFSTAISSPATPPAAVTSTFEESAAPFWSIHEWNERTSTSRPHSVVASRPQSAGGRSVRSIHTAPGSDADVSDSGVDVVPVGHDRSDEILSEFGESDAGTVHSGWTEVGSEVSGSARG